MIAKKITGIITIDELHSQMKSAGDMVLLDTLPQAHYQRKHLPEALNACVFEVTFPARVAEIVTEKDKSIVVYGANEQTHDSKVAAEKLLRAGYSQVSILAGGLAAWQSAGYPLDGNAVDDEAPAKAQLADGTYPVDTRDSVIEWSGRNPNSTHRGTLHLSAGEIKIDAGRITGHFTIDMKSIENVNLVGDELKPVLEAHLKSDDFFFVDLFPEAVFEMTAAPTVDDQPVSVPNYQVSGRLKLRGVSAEQNFPATIVTTDEGRIAAEAHFDIDRTRWGVIYGSTKFFEHLGMHLVFDQVSLQLRILTE